jgi:hypothetical protein
VLRTKFFKWGSSSLKGHLVLFELFFSIPLLVTFLVSDYSDGTLTIGWAIWSVFVWAIAGAAVAVAFWFTVSSALIKNRRDKA